MPNISQAKTIQIHNTSYIGLAGFNTGVFHYVTAMIYTGKKYNKVWIPITVIQQFEL